MKKGNKSKNEKSDLVNQSYEGQGHHKNHPTSLLGDKCELKL